MSRQRSRREDFHWFKPQEVRWGDMDALGHVNNAVYLTYSESARIAFFDELFGRDPDFMDGTGPILAGVDCNYHAQIHYPARLDVAVGIQSVGHRSLVISCPVFLAGQDEAAADMRCTIVWFDYRTQRSIPVPDRLREMPRLPEP